MFLVPGRGYTGVLSGVVNAAEFTLLGPFTRGQWIYRIDVASRTNGSGTIEAGAVLTESNTASLDAWRSGAPVVTRSQTFGDGQPVFKYGQGNNNMRQFRWAVGVRVASAPLYVVCRAITSGAQLQVDMLFTGFCLELLSSGAGNGAV